MSGKEYLRSVQAAYETLENRFKHHSQPIFAQTLRMLSQALFLLPALALASVTVEDPSDVLNPSWWKADNALAADYNVAMYTTQPTDSKYSLSRGRGTRKLSSVFKSRLPIKSRGKVPAPAMLLGQPLPMIPVCSWWPTMPSSLAPT